MEQLIPFWEFGGLSCESYAAFLDTRNFHSGSQSACLHSAVETPPGMAGLYQTIHAGEYAGKRIRFSAWVKSEFVEDRCGIHLCVGITPHPQEQAQDDNIKGTTDWQKLTTVVDVAENSLYITMAAILCGFGTVWIDDASLEVVGLDTPSANKIPKSPEKNDFLPEPAAYPAPASGAGPELKEPKSKILQLRPNNMDFEGQARYRR